MKSHVKIEQSFAQDLPKLVAQAELSQFPTPELILWNEDLAKELGVEALKEEADYWVGNSVPDGGAPMAMAYSGHQFGGFSPVLGDGRAWLMGEVFSDKGVRQDIHLKGVGITPFSRPNTDGKAALGPVLREYVMGEAMHAMGAPTSRALAASLTGEAVFRNGMKPGAVLTRIATSHIRVGTFQYAAIRQDHATLKNLADYTIARHYPDLKNANNPYLSLLYEVARKQASLIAKWMGLGFVHGVMNTDNMAVSGETIDYGPCAFMEAFDLNTVFSSIDAQGRYAYGNQPAIAQWNLARFADALLPLIHKNPDDALALAQRSVQDFAKIYSKNWQEEMSAKLGHSEYDEKLIHDMNVIMSKTKVDFTLFFSNLANENDFANLLDGDEDALTWRKSWLKLAPDYKLMERSNSVYIPRNEILQNAIDVAENELEFAPIREIIAVVTNPFTKRKGLEVYEKPASKSGGPFVTYCGT